jgi:sec-independent protein translocase protein TatB
MFGMGFTEILFIAVIAIIFLGPDKLPGAMVEIAKFIKNMKNAITDAKNTLNEEVNLEELKREALGYKEQLEAANDELRGFKNLNPLNELKESANLGSVKENFERMTQRPPETVTTQVEQKQSKEITFKKKTVKETSLKEVKKENRSEDE